MKKTFIFNIDWVELLADYPAEVRLEVYDAIFEYAASGTLIELKPLAKVAFRFFKKQMDDMESRHNAICAKRRANGRLGGAKKGNQNAVKNKQKQAKTSKNKLNEQNELMVVSQSQQPENKEIENKQMVVFDVDALIDSITKYIYNTKYIDNNIINSLTNLNKEEREKYGKEKQEKFVRFNRWIDEHAQNVRKLPSQITLTQFAILSYYPAQLVRDVLLAMENCKDLVKKYNSVYLTALSWLKKRMDNGNNTTNKRLYVRDADEFVDDSTI